MNKLIPSLATFMCDFYKVNHKDMYAPGTEVIYSNFTPRSTKLFKGSKLYDNKVVSFGYQMFIKDYLIKEWNESFFELPLQEVVSHYKRFMDYTLGDGAVSTDYITALHKLGYLPIKIKVLPEGTRFPINIPCLTIVNTKPEFYWLTNYLESVLSTELWKPMTTATTAFEFKRTFDYYAELTGAVKELTPFQGHDFSFRGLSNRQDAMKSSIGHLLSFVGTDTIPAIIGAETWYNADIQKELVGTSVPATEHSTMVSNIAYIKQQFDDHEYAHFFDKNGNMYEMPMKFCQYDETHTDTQKLAEIAYINWLITEKYPTGIISIVADSFDFWYMMEYGIKILKKDIENRQPNAFGLAKVVFRPDSGNPVDIICGVGKQCLTNDECVQKGAIQCLYETFGSTTNDKGYKSLNPRVGLIYGDSITLERQEQILSKLATKKYASDCIVLGIGSYSYQHVTRDTLGFAMKATYTEINGNPIDIYKDPKTSKGSKKSAKGLLCVHNTDFGTVLQQQCTKEQENGHFNALQTIFCNGKLVKETSLQAIRDNLVNSSN